MAPVITISDTNWERLKTWAVPLEDDADSALGKVLSAAEFQRAGYHTRTSPSSDDGETASTVAPSGLVEYDLGNGPDFGHPARYRRGRRRKGEKLPQAAYETPILEALNELGGKAGVKQVLEKVEQRMKHLFSDVEDEYPPTGTEKRWRNTARWARAALVQQGLIIPDSKRGTWELTPEGVAVANGKKQRRS